MICVKMHWTGYKTFQSQPKIKTRPRGFNFSWNQDFYRHRRSS